MSKVHIPMAKLIIVFDPYEEFITFTEGNLSATFERKILLDMLFSSLKANEIKKIQKYSTDKKNNHQSPTLTIKFKGNDKTKEVVFEIYFKHSVIKTGDQYYILNKTIGESRTSSIKSASKIEQPQSLDAQQEEDPTEIIIKVKRIALNYNIAFDKENEVKNEFVKDVEKEVESTQPFDPASKYLGSRTNFKYLFKTYAVQTQRPGLNIFHAFDDIKNNWSFNEILALFKNIAVALKAIHDQNIVHGDIHMPNILTTGHIIDYELVVKEGGKSKGGSKARHPAEKWELKEGTLTDSEKIRTKQRELFTLAIDVFLKFFVNEKDLSKIMTDVIRYGNQPDAFTYSVDANKLNEVLRISNFKATDEKEFKKTFDNIFKLFEDMLGKTEKIYTIDDVISQLDVINKNYEEYLNIKKNDKNSEKSYKNRCIQTIDKVEALLKTIDFKNSSELIKIYILNLKRTVDIFKKQNTLSYQELIALYRNLYGFYIIDQSPENSATSTIFRDTAGRFLDKDEYFNVVSIKFPKKLNDHSLDEAIENCDSLQQLLDIFFRYHIVPQICPDKNEQFDNDFKWKNFLTKSSKITKKLLEENTELFDLLLRIEASLTQAQSILENKINLKILDFALHYLKSTKNLIKTKLNNLIVTSADITEVFDSLENYTQVLFNAKAFLEKRYPTSMLYELTVGLILRISKCYDSISYSAQNELNSFIKDRRLLEACQSTNFSLANIRMRKIFDVNNIDNLNIVFQNLEKQLGNSISTNKLTALLPSLSEPTHYLTIAYTLTRVNKNKISPKSLLFLTRLVKIVENKISKTPAVRVAHVINLLQTNAANISVLSSVSKRSEQDKIFIRELCDKICFALNNDAVTVDLIIPFLEKSSLACSTIKKLMTLWPLTNTLQDNDARQKLLDSTSSLKNEITPLVSPDEIPKNVKEHYNLLRTKADSLVTPVKENIQAIVENLEKAFETLSIEEESTASYLKIIALLEQGKKTLYGQRSAIDVFGLFNPVTHVCLNAIKNIEICLNQEEQFDSKSSFSCN